MTNTDTDDSALNQMEIYVDETYTYDFLALQCEVNGMCESVNVNCEGQNTIAPEQMESDGIGGFFCKNGGASYCCPTNTNSPTTDPTESPTVPSLAPTVVPSSAPTADPTTNPTEGPTVPSSEPTVDPTT